MTGALLPLEPACAVTVRVKFIELVAQLPRAKKHGPERTSLPLSWSKVTPPFDSTERSNTGAFDSIVTLWPKRRNSVTPKGALISAETWMVLAGMLSVY